MTEQQPPLSQPIATQTETTHAGYQAAIALWVSEGQQIWARFNAMLVVHSILVAASGLVLASMTAPLLVMALSIAGILICGLWFVLMKRDFEFQSYLIYATREIEEMYLSPVRVVSQGGQFTRGNPVEFVIDGQVRTRQMSRTSRLVRDRTATYLTILVFGLLYLVMVGMAFL